MNRKIDHQTVRTSHCNAAGFNSASGSLIHGVSFCLAELTPQLHSSGLAALIGVGWRWNGDEEVLPAVVFNNLIVITVAAQNGLNFLRQFPLGIHIKMNRHLAGGKIAHFCFPAFKQGTYFLKIACGLRFNKRFVHTALKY
ncbi:MAG: hypothetical protein WCH99_04290 [Verrucomicrobiota bacterium]